MMRKPMLVVAATAICTALAHVIIASAPDDYRVAYAVAELDAAFTDQVVLEVRQLQ